MKRSGLHVSTLGLWMETCCSLGTKCLHTSSPRVTNLEMDVAWRCTKKRVCTSPVHDPRFSPHLFTQAPRNPADGPLHWLAFTLALHTHKRLKRSVIKGLIGFVWVLLCIWTKNKPFDAFLTRRWFNFLCMNRCLWNVCVSPDYCDVFLLITV